MKSIVLVSIAALLIGCGSDPAQTNIYIMGTGGSSGSSGSTAASGGSENDSGTVNVPDATGTGGNAGNATGGAGGDSGVGGSGGVTAGGSSGTGGSTGGGSGTGGTGGVGGNPTGGAGGDSGTGGNTAGSSGTGGTTVVDSGVCTAAETIITTEPVSECIQCVEQSDCAMFTLCYDTGGCGEWLRNFNHNYRVSHSVEIACSNVSPSSSGTLMSSLSTKIVRSKCVSCLHGYFDGSVVPSYCK
jgi:hypothetical protein